MWWKISVDCDEVAFEVVSDFLIERGSGGIEEQGSSEGRKIAVAYLKKGPGVQGVIGDLEELIGGLLIREYYASILSRQEVAEENWQEEWERYIKPIEIGGSLVIKPPWEPYENDKGRTVIDLDPGGMVFGSGHHETTIGCLEFMETLNSCPRSFLDIGAGTGILCIAAYKLGIKKVRGLDIDPIAVECAARNFIRNGLDPSDVSDRPLEEVVGCFDLVAANLIDSKLLEFSPIITRLVNPEGSLILSGILDKNAGSVGKAYGRLGWRVIGEKRAGEWVSLLFFRINQSES